MRRTLRRGRGHVRPCRWTKARRLNVEAKRVNVDFPTWVVAGLDRQAQKLGITRQALIKMWIAERLE
ncbi:type II toxin-antitoxin system BrnA family antitoxin [Roseovarius sp. 217]|uniref:type II toxin-antitoxin system BrnA family antitoxin n=1 Tax=Roseovarius sp. (strain 217) TaxID=314264 RepID=UPI003F8D735D